MVMAVLVVAFEFLVAGPWPVDALEKTPRQRVFEARGFGLGVVLATPRQRVFEARGVGLVVVLATP